MGFLARLVRMLLWLAVFSWAAWLVRRVFRGLLESGAPREVHPAPLVPRPLYRDPWCGTHVSADISHSLEQAGQVLHFCSAECRERYSASQRQAASG